MGMWQLDASSRYLAPGICLGKVSAVLNRVQLIIFSRVLPGSGAYMA